MTARLTSSVYVLTRWYCSLEFLLERGAMEITINREIGKLGLPRHLVLGMDPGIASCGFALIDTANHEILDLGVRLFDSPNHPKTGQSLAVIRRGFRSTRRNIDRTQARLKHCLQTLKAYGVIPQDATKEYFHTTKGDKQPLKLRVQGLDRPLSNREWALVLYSLCKRRGYIPHGEGSQDKSSEGGKILSALAANKEALAETPCRTVGEWLAQQPQSRNRGGNYDKCVTHAQLIDETHILFEAQRSFGSAYASPEFEAAYIEVCDWERSRKDFDRRSYDLGATISLAAAHTSQQKSEPHAVRLRANSLQPMAHSATSPSSTKAEPLAL